ncbi:hypothetical protein WME89_39690 [Sorangium sp. So ce321]|uniref:aldose epimerase family protein n=1 Tax=Sorangium sp. So ce321 TaxID=3133300 RepID=UPI003F63044C
MNAKPASVSRAPFGDADGKEVVLYTLTNTNGLVAKVMTCGATVTELHAPDKTGRVGDIVLGHDDLDGYLKSSPYLGARAAPAALADHGERRARGKSTRLFAQQRNATQSQEDP